jgi:hypothetical protein
MNVYRWQAESRQLGHSRKLSHPAGNFPTSTAEKIGDSLLGWYPSQNLSAITPLGKFTGLRLSISLLAAIFKPASPDLQFTPTDGQFWTQEKAGLAA